MSPPPGFTRLLAARVVRWGVVLLAVWNLARAAVLWQDAAWLTGLPLSPDPLFRMAMAFFWAILFLIAAVALRHRPGLRRLVPMLLAAYGVYELGLIILYASSPPAMLPTLAYGAFVAFAGWALRWPAKRIHLNQGGS